MRCTGPSSTCPLVLSPPTACESFAQAVVDVVVIVVVVVFVVVIVVVIVGVLGAYFVVAHVTLVLLSLWVSLRWPLIMWFL